MKLNDRRLDQVSSGLSPKERAVLRIRAFKEDGPEPSGLYRSTPDAQIAAVNDLLALANATQREISWYGIWLQARMETIALRFSVLGALRLREIQEERLRMHLLLDAGEPITASELAALTSAIREELAPVADLAVLLFECEEDDAESEQRPVVGTIATRERQLRELVADGTLTGDGEGDDLRLLAGAFYDWRGTETQPVPEWGMTFEVFPDAAAEQVGRLRTQRETLRQRLSTGPGAEHEKANLGALAERIMETIAAELTAAWAELLALDEVLTDVAAQFSGEEPLHPAGRALLEEAKERIRALITDLSENGFDLVLPTEPEPRVRQMLAAIIEQEAVLP